MRELPSEDVTLLVVMDDDVFPTAVTLPGIRGEGPGFFSGHGHV